MNPHITILQLEQALNSFQNGIYNEAGELCIDQRWLAVFDDLLVQLIQSRSLLKMPEAEEGIEWNKLAQMLSLPTSYKS